MKILLLAPHPFYQERGTPIAVDLLLRVLSKRNDTIDVLTYHEGSDRDYGDNVRIFRVNPPARANGVKPGLSMKKLICDYYMRPEAFRLCKENQYDIVHAVEESVFMAMEIKRKFGIPYVMDMDSSMPQQISDKHPLMKPVLPIMRAFEKSAVKSARAVVAVCDELAELADKYGSPHTVTLRDISLTVDNPEPLQPPMKEELGIRGLMYLYIGNLEVYQGIELLLRSFEVLQSQTEGADLVIIGGAPEDIKKYRELSIELGISEKTHFLGPKPVHLMTSFFMEADVLVSPRIQGGNTPMKIYSYMDSGKPILATKLNTHTQVLDEETALLEPPDPHTFGQGMIRLMQNSKIRSTLAENAKKIAREKYSFDTFSKTLNDLYDTMAT